MVGCSNQLARPAKAEKTQVHNKAQEDVLLRAGRDFSSIKKFSIFLPDPVWNQHFDKADAFLRA